MLMISMPFENATVKYMFHWLRAVIVKLGCILTKITKSLTLITGWKEWSVQDCHNMEIRELI